VRRAAFLLVATLSSAVLLAACGGSSSGLIPANNSASLGTDLSSLATALDSYSCAGADTALGAILTDINALPSSVAGRLRNNLLRGYEGLDNTARTQCKPTGHHPHTGQTGTSHPTGVSTSPTGVSTSPTGVSTSPTGVSTSPTGLSTGPSGTSVGPGGGSPAPPGSSGDSGSTSGGAVG